MADEYLRLSGTGRAETKVRGSRFLAEALPADSETAAGALIEDVRRREYKATHHCTAYRVGAEEPLERFDDNGEPSGTAGRPILRQIEARGLSDALVVVTRYYGGTKLGTGGLIRAYGAAASAALDDAAIGRVILRDPVEVRFAYADTSPVMHLVSQFDAIIDGTQYGEETTMQLFVRRSQRDGFILAFAEALGGRGDARG